MLQRKREALDNHMETLEHSELNQHVLHSMQRTSNALKAMGLDKSLKDVDKVMLDLEENHSDISSLQQTLGMSYMEDESVDWGLELSSMLNMFYCTCDDCVSPNIVQLQGQSPLHSKHRTPSREAQTRQAHSHTQTIRYI